MLLLLNTDTVSVTDTHTVMYAYTALVYKVQAGRPKNSIFFGQHLSRDYWPPGHENPAMGLFWGVDQD